MKYLIPAIVAVVSLCAAEVQACHPVAIVAPQAVYAAPVVAQQVVAAPVVYQAQVVAQPVAYAVTAPVVQQVVVKQRVRRHPLRRAAQLVLPPYGNRQGVRLNLQVGGCCQ